MEDSPAMEPRPGFQSTLWSVILRAREGSAEERQAALEKLCQIYWPPLYAYLIRKGQSREDALDTVQGFFAYFIEKALMDRADPDRGRFRNYILTVLENWLASEYRKARAEKRGGGRAPLSFDFGTAGAEEHVDPPDKEVPEDAFNRSWALTVLRRAQDLLRREFESRDLGAHYLAICSHLSGEPDRPSYEELSKRLGCSVGEVNALLYSARRRLRDLVRSVLRETVESESEVEQEVKDLFRFLLKK